MPGMSAMHYMPGMSSPSHAAGDMKMNDTKMMMHMTFFWGKNGSILFSGWPGSDGGMHVLSLFSVFLLSVIVKWLSYCNLMRDDNGSDYGLLRTFLYTVRVGLAFLVMLVVMSFNVGVFIVAVVGHGVGFLLFGVRVFRKSSAPVLEKPYSDLPKMTC